jgi:hypothetical protein
MSGYRIGALLLLAALPGFGCATVHYATPAAALEAVAADAPTHDGTAVAFGGRVFEAEAQDGTVRFLVAVDGAQLVAYCEYPREDAGIATGTPLTLLGFVQGRVPSPLPLPGASPDFAVRVVAVEVTGGVSSHLDAHDGLYRRWIAGSLPGTVPTP